MNKKYLGYGLAILVIVVIFGVFISVGSLVYNTVTNSREELKEEKTSYKDIDIKNLNIELSASKLVIVKGEDNTITTNNSHIRSNIKDNTLTIKEKKHFIFNNRNYEVILTINEDTFDSVNIKTGAGKIEIDELNANSLNMELGAGLSIIKNLEVYENANINGGVGEIQILDGSLNNLNLELGVGKSTITSNITGKSKIESGIGEAIINLNNNKDNYTISLEKGIGNIYFDGEKISNSKIGKGNNILDIESGIGSIRLNFNSEVTENIIESNIKVIDYFQNKDSEWIIVGQLLSGKFHNNDEITLYQNEEIIGTKTLNDVTNIYTNKTIEESSIKDKVYIKLDNIDKLQLEMVSNIKLK